MREPEAPNSRRRRGSVLQYAGSGYAAALFGILTGPIVARVLGPTGRGEYAAVIIYSTFAASLLAFGMTLTVAYAILNLRIERSLVYGVVLRFCALLIVPASIAALVAYELLGGISDEARLGVTVFIAAAPLVVLQLCLNSFLLAESALGALTVVRMTPLLFNVAGVLALAFTGHLTLASYLVVTFVGSLAVLAVTISSVRVRPRRGGRLGPQLGHGIRVYVGSLAYLGNGQLDQALIVPFLGAADLGQYAIAVAMANLPLGLVQAVSAREVATMTLPAGGLDAVRVEYAIRRCAGCGLLFSLAVAATVPLLVPILYGGAFAPVVGLSLALLPGTVALSVSTAANLALNLAGRGTALTVAELAGLVATGLGLTLLLPVAGVIAASVISTLAYTIRMSVQLLLLRREGVRRVLPRMEDVAAPTLLVYERLAAWVHR